MSIVTQKDDRIIIQALGSDSRSEVIGRAIAIVSDEKIGVADHPCSKAALMRGVIWGTLSKSIRIGKAMQEAREKGASPVQVVINGVEGWLLFQGEVKETSWGLQDGFTVGEVVVAGANLFDGRSYKIWYKNENIMSWFDGQVDVTVPDLITVVDSRTGEAVINPNYEVGMPVAVIGSRAEEIWRTQKGLEIFGPSHFGYNVDYVPIERNNRLQ